METIEEIKYLTFNELWQGYSSNSTSPELSIFEWIKENGIIRKSFYFTGYARGEDRIRVFSRMYTPTSPKAAVLYIGNPRTKGFSEDVLQKLADLGLIVATCDFYGGVSGEATVFAPSLSQYSGRFADLSVATPSVENNATFIWATIMRRLYDIVKINFAGLKIGVIGEGYGALSAWQLAAVVPEIAAVGLLNGGEYTLAKQLLENPEDGTGLIDSNWERWQAGITPKIYAMNVEAPVFAVACTNSHISSFDNLWGTLALTKGEKLLSACPRLEKQIYSKQFETFTKWLTSRLLGESEPYPQSTLTAAIEDKSYLFTVSGDLKAADLYFSFNQNNPRYRNWHCLTMQKKGEVFEVDVPGYCSDRIVYAFANVTTKNDELLSTPLQKIMLEGKGLSDKQKPPLFVLFDSLLNSGTSNLSLETEGLILDEAGETFIEDDLGVMGLHIEKGSLCNYKIGEVALQNAMDDRILQLTAKVLKDMEFKVVLRKLGDEATEEQYYSVSKQLTKSDEWQKLTFALSDFKAESGQAMKDWQDLVKLELVATDEIVINSLLWI